MQIDLDEVIKIAAQERRYLRRDAKKEHGKAFIAITFQKERLAPSENCLGLVIPYQVITDKGFGAVKFFSMAL